MELVKRFFPSFARKVVRCKKCGFTFRRVHGVDTFRQLKKKLKEDDCTYILQHFFG